MTATGAPAAAATQATAATSAVAATSAWLRPIVRRALQVIDDDVPGVIDAGDARHVVELGEIGERQRTGVLARVRVDREVLAGGGQQLAEPPVDEDVHEGLRLDLLRGGRRERRRGVQVAVVTDRVLVAVAAQDRQVAFVGREPVTGPERRQCPFGRGDLLGAYRSFGPGDLVWPWQPFPVRRPAVDQPVEYEDQRGQNGGGDHDRRAVPRTGANDRPAQAVVAQPDYGQGGDEAGRHEDERRGPSGQFAAVRD